MQLQRRRRRVTDWSALALVLGALALLAASSAGATGTYDDPTGDSGATAADITNVSVASDSYGTIVFRINATAPAAGNAVVGLALDTDQNPLTGSPDFDGAEFIFFVDNASLSYDFEQWNGSDWGATPYSTVHVTSGTSGVGITVNKSELGNTTGFNLWAISLGADGTSDRDLAPDTGAWNYSLAAGGPDIRDVRVTTAPARGPVAGHRFTLTPESLQLPAHGGLNEFPKPDSYTCSAKLRGKTIVGTGAGGCTWKLPKKARGLLVVTLTVGYQGAKKSVPFTYRVAKR
ncbi:MAG: hypothetical protein QOE36_193 [Gaiellaceae bacterium]|jgi:hypothetical protein|nr:hypothetical protein [Gaiellaceae bacterium]